MDANSNSEPKRPKWSLEDCSGGHAEVDGAMQRSGTIIVTVQLGGYEDKSFFHEPSVEPCTRFDRATPSQAAALTTAASDDAMRLRPALSATAAAAAADLWSLTPPPIERSDSCLAVPAEPERFQLPAVRALAPLESGQATSPVASAASPPADTTPAAPGQQPEVSVDDEVSIESPPFVKKRVKLLGRGGQGEVWEVLTDKNIRCAEKTIGLRVQLGEGPDLQEQRIENFVKGEQNLCQLHHQNIVRFLHITHCLQTSTIVLLMELLEGMSLENFINKKPLDEGLIREFLMQICSALHYLHSQNPHVIHRDINCSNIIVLTEGNRIKLIDFGLSIKVMSATATHYTGNSGDSKGTPNFMAPELLGSKDSDRMVYSRESDIWALGCTVYQMVTGTRPHSECGNSSFAIFNKVIYNGSPELSDTDCSSLLRNFYESCVARDRKSRRSAAELLEHSFLSSPKVPPFVKTWQPVKFLGRGGFGDVWEVLTDKNIRCVAKTIGLPVQLGEGQDLQEQRIENFVNGEQNLCQLRHQNIVRFLHLAQQQNFTIVLFMEILEGRSLENFINKKPLDEGLIREFSMQICSALFYLHSQNPHVIHRDVNCSNIIVLTEGNRIKLIDFGLSIKLMSATATHYTGTSFHPNGTPNFMAPELLGSMDSDRMVYSRESDIWAFGCTVYQMATGTRPHAECGDVFQVWRSIKKHGAPALPDPHCSSSLKTFYKNCVAQDRKDRRSAAELLEHAFLSPKVIRTFHTDHGQASVETLWDEEHDMQHGEVPVLTGERYSMRSRTRGVAMVINMVDFFNNGGHCSRHGAMADTHENGLYRAFTKLGLQVEMHMNTGSQFFTNLLTHNRSEAAYANHDVFLLCIMSHGELGRVFGSDGEMVELEDVFRQVRDCSALAGKPKIFIVQACRHLAGPHPAATPPSKVQNHQDCLYVYSGAEGSLSERSIDTGGNLTKALRDVIVNSDLRVIEFTNLITTVANRVARETAGRQVPISISTLTKLLFF